MPDNNEIEVAVLNERQRCLRILERFRTHLDEIQLFEVLYNRVNNEDYDPGSADFEEDRPSGY